MLGPGSHSQFLFLPKVSDGVEVRVLCNPVRFFFTKVEKPSPFLDLDLCTGTLSCWNRKGTNKNCLLETQWNIIIRCGILITPDWNEGEAQTMINSLRHRIHKSLWTEGSTQLVFHSPTSAQAYTHTWARTVTRSGSWRTHPSPVLCPHFSSSSFQFACYSPSSSSSFFTSPSLLFCFSLLQTGFLHGSHQAVAPCVAAPSRTKSDLTLGW